MLQPYTWVGADHLAEWLGDLVLQLDREVRHAAGGVQDPRVDDGAGWTRLQAQRAGSALVERRGGGVERQAAQDLRQEQPRPEVGVDDTRVLADPPQPGMLRVDTLLDRSGVDVRLGLERDVAGLPHPLE